MKILEQEKYRRKETDKTTNDRLKVVKRKITQQLKKDEVKEKIAETNEKIEEKEKKERALWLKRGHVSGSPEVQVWVQSKNL